MEKSKVYGKALYLEFQTDGGLAVLQVLITPDMTGPNGQVIPMSLYRRRLTEVKPRTAWKHYPNYDTVPRTESTREVVKLESKFSALEVAKNRLSYTSKFMLQLRQHGYKLRGKPIAVEIGVADLDVISAGMTPYKILSRVTKSRKVLGMPDSLLNLTK